VLCLLILQPLRGVMIWVVLSFSKFTAALPPSDIDGVGRKAGARHKAYFEFLATKRSFSGATGQECKMRLYVKSRGYRDLPASSGLVTGGSAAASCRSASNLLKRLECQKRLAARLFARPAGLGCGGLGST
jgi:hypothetical protein